MSKFTQLLAVLALMACAASAISTVSQVNVPQYVGRWYQAYGDKIIYDTFEKDGYCVGAEYALENDGKISVFNFQREGSPTGPARNITGYAKQTDASEPGRLKVYFFGPLSGGDYWILKLGPVVNGQYQYSIVSDPLKLGLYVLVRDVDEFKAKWQSEVLAYLTSEGFTHGFDKPELTVQGGDCLYPPQQQ